MSFAKRFIGAENLPTRLSEFDVQQAFSLSKDDIAAVAERFRHDRRVAAAIRMLFLRASGRPMDRFASVPKTLLRSVCDAFQTPAVSIASLRSLYSTPPDAVRAPGLGPHLPRPAGPRRDPG